ncbi:MAG: caspase family protein [Bacteroidota bacterium]|nr:caspase family protein [Bacteroidota bacterium]
MKKLLLILLCFPMIGFGQKRKKATQNNGTPGICRGNCENGFGSYSYTKKEAGKERGTYVGEWKNGEFHGVGSYVWWDGSSYVGMWNNGKRTYGMLSSTSYTQTFNMYISTKPKIQIWLDDNWDRNNWTSNLKEGVTHINIPFSKKSIKKNIKEIVETRISIWQEKGEFEKTSDYRKRVNENSRNIMIKEIQEEAIRMLKEIHYAIFEIFHINTTNFSNFSSAPLKKDQVASTRGYIDPEEYKLKEYDADNESFLIESNQLGEIIISVPISAAKNFKENFPKDMVFRNVDFIIIDDKFVLSHLEIHNYWYHFTGAMQTNVYTYDYEGESLYAITNINYDFLEIKEFDLEETSLQANIAKRKKNITVSRSKVDTDIPKNKKVKNRYALVIGNEDYQSKQRGLSDEQNVDYAINDAIIFKEYTLRALGVKEDNMFFLTNATAVEMGQEIKRIAKMMEKLGEKAELIIYYAGHGHPHENTKTPYLIPVDVSADNLSYAIKLHDLYRDLSATNAKRITIFIDACFTGGGRSSGLMASRGVRIKPKGGTLNGNIVVFSASSGEQSALPYHKEGHGMFTYYLLKKLQESKGSVKMGELADYLKDEVSLQSLKINKKEQDPVVNTSKDIVENWKDWEF